MCFTNNNTELAPLRLCQIGFKNNFLWHHYLNIYISGFQENPLTKSLNFYMPLFNIQTIKK